MVALLSLFLNNLLPIGLAAGSSFLLARRFNLSPRMLNQVVFYLFSPCLVFNLLTRSQLSGSDIGTMFVLAALMWLVNALLAFAGGRLLGLDRRMIAAVVLASAFMNAGNFGMPVVDFAFGATSLAYASLFFIGSSILAYSVGTLIASMGTVGLRESFLNMLKMPSIYTALLALLFVERGWTLPLPVGRVVDLFANATIPCMLVILGLQLSAARWTAQVRPLALVVGVRLIASPLIAFLLFPLFGLERAALQASILESAMPTAVLTTVLATEFNTEPEFVTYTVFLSTLLSPLTLTPLMYFLGAAAS